MCFLGLIIRVRSQLWPQQFQPEKCFLSVTTALPAAGMLECVLLSGVCLEATNSVLKPNIDCRGHLEGVLMHQHLPADPGIDPSLTDPGANCTKSQTIPSAKNPLIQI